MKKKKHNKLIKDYDKQKEKHLEKLATKMLENDEKINKLKGKNGRYMKSCNQHRFFFKYFLKLFFV